MIIYSTRRGVDFFQFFKDNQLLSTLRWNFIGRKTKTRKGNWPDIFATGIPIAITPIL